MQHRHLRQFTDFVDFWVIITHRNAGHVRLWSAERGHIALKLPPLSYWPANSVVAKDFQLFQLNTYGILNTMKHHEIYEVGASRCFISVKPLEVT